MSIQIDIAQLYMNASGEITEEPSEGAELYALRLIAGEGADEVFLDLPLGGVESAAIVVNETQLVVSMAAMEHIRALLELVTTAPRQRTRQRLEAAHKLDTLRAMYQHHKVTRGPQSAA